MNARKVSIQDIMDFEDCSKRTAVRVRNRIKQILGIEGAIREWHLKQYYKMD